ncbi:hypothetical protein H2200_005260 [Cladophialophora chaetospira]|uniref:Uncharacterized protein n=1 Tax=Cladophialophora chaetospira TaxID=386627 RepID=A0AA39CJQ8_9EURO|nr:hypothetical protein H2200_005260 [Cladophialophora chaetospira]
MNTAMQMGLDQPRPEKIAPGFHACFNISTSVSVWLGVPPHLSSPAQLNAISSTAKEPDVPQQFMVQVEIQRQVVQYSTSLAGDVDTSTVSTLLNLFNNELDNLLNAYKSIWSARLEIQLLGAKLYLFSLCLTVVTKRHNHADGLAKSYVSNPARLPVQLGLPTAVSLIHNISGLNKETSLRPHLTASGVIHYPKFYFRLVVFAVSFLMKFLSANPNASQEDRELAISHITTAHQFFSSFPVGEDFARVAQVIEVLASNLRADRDEEAVAVKTRSGASVLYDIIEKFKGPSKHVVEPASVAAPPNETWTKDDGISRTTSLGTVESATSLWASTGPYAPGFQPDLEDGLNSFQWMSDDMLAEMFRM